MITRDFMSTDMYADFKKLYLTDFEIRDTFAMRQKWVEGCIFNMSFPRKTAGIIFLKNCRGTYISKSGVKFYAPPKSLICLPQGSVYTCINLNCTNTIDDAILIEFNVIKENKILSFSDSPFLIRDVNIPIAAELLNNTVQAYEASVHSPLAVKSSIYQLLSHICKDKMLKNQEHFSPISSGIELIEANPLSEISIEDIANSCNVSTCYFRRLFKQYSGKSPLQYRMELRLNMAKRMLENGESSLEYISEALNFESTSYFCRIFKKKFGITAGQYRKSKTPQNK